MNDWFEPSGDIECIFCGSADFEGWDRANFYGWHIRGGESKGDRQVGHDKQRYSCNDCGFRWVA